VGKAKPYSDQVNWSNTYLTDPKLVKLLGPFDMDPCCPPKMPWRTAKVMITDGYAPRSRRRAVYPVEGCGLEIAWKGRVFMNPPYRGVMAWAKRFAEHGYGIALLNGRSTETRATQLIMNHARAIWFPNGRLTFYRVTGKPFHQKWFPSLLLGMGIEDVKKLQRAQKQYGGYIFLSEG
jgi:hypothetical protein